MKLLRLLRQVGQTLIFPQRCVLCEEWVCNPDISPLCGPCLQGIPSLNGPCCEVCGCSLPLVLPDRFLLCSRCRSGKCEYDFARSYGPYEGSLRRLVRDFKFQGRRRLSEPLSGLLLQALQRASSEESADWIVPVPLHPARRCERGFDQTQLLAQGLSRRLGIPVFPHLRRVRATRPQFGLRLEDRRKNVKGAFQVQRPELLYRRRILIVDDVLTTGSTVRELARHLRSNASVARLAVVTVGRVPLLYSDDW